MRDQSDVPKLFGYDLKKHKWDEIGLVIHCWLGHLTIWLCWFQIVMGLKKRWQLENTGVRRFPQHGMFGRFLMVSAWFLMSQGVYGQFSGFYRVFLLSLMAICCGYGVFAPSAPKTD